MAALPEWLMEDMEPTGDPAWKRASKTARRGLGKGLRKSIAGFGRTLGLSLSDRSIAEKRGLLQAFDPRAKVLGIVALVVAVSVQESIAVLSLVCVACLALAVASRVPAGRFAGVLLAAPLFSVLVIAPAVLNVVSGGRPVLEIWPLPLDALPAWMAAGPHIAVTDAGLLIASRFVLRTSACVTLAVLLTATTGAPKLFRGLRAVGVPRVFVMILAMMERYLEVLVRAAQEIHMAKMSRSVSQEAPGRERAWVAAGIGAMFRRARSLGDRVYDAMISRGYTGEPHTWERLRWRPKDAVFVVSSVGLAALLVIVRRGI